MNTKTCPKCESNLVSERISSSTYALKCTKCGFYKEVKGIDLERD